jgi:hypothetical protein
MADVIAVRTTFGGEQVINGQSHAEYLSNLTFLLAVATNVQYKPIVEALDGQVLLFTHREL